MTAICAGCAEQNQQLPIVAEEPDAYEDFFDFTLGADAVDFSVINTDPPKYSLDSLGTFKAKHVSHRELVFYNLDADSLPLFDAKSLKLNFPKDRFYAVSYENGLTSVFKFSSIKIQGNTIVINNNLKWHSLPPKNKQEEQKITLWSFEFDPQESGEVSLSFVGDSQFHFQEAQDLRRGLDVLFGRALKFNGKHLDNNGYRFHAYNNYTLFDLQKSLDDLPESDYYLINIGTNEWKKPVQKTLERLQAQILKLQDNFPSAKILLHTIMPVSTSQRDHATRLLWAEQYNQGIRDFVDASTSENLILVDLEEIFSPADDVKWFKKDGVHLSALFYKEYSAVLEALLLENPKLVEHYTGTTEDFERFPLSDKLGYHTSSTTTTAGYYKLVTIDSRTALRTELGPTENLKGPHRSEMTMDLDAYYVNDKMSLSIEFMVPESWELDQDNLNNGRRTMILQIHSKPEEGQTWAYYQKNLPFNRPAIALYVTSKPEGLFAELYYGLNGKLNTDFADKKWSRVASTPIEKGQWNLFELNYQLAFDDSGYLSANLNSNPLIDAKDAKAFGPNMHNKARPYLKFGQYRYWTDSHTHHVLFDNLKVGTNTKQVLD
ncbi:heparin lyase I family protein [Gilvibacter sediminis]|uniref:heparin lyase I family protein n=1 Tax=Gilvibacter sediminis TaxID=379071 RepID=UPI00234FB6FC|nr:heparin lyase I family protein [Gilvibacter sediminis]MDC7996788.1 heparin lyase I family protein [Gilvibacter sediminis]